MIENRKSPNAKRGKRHPETVSMTQPHIDFVLPGATQTITIIRPDSLTLSDICVAEGLRGWVVRAFFWIMRLWRV